LLYFVRDKKVVGVFVRFRAPLPSMYGNLHEPIISNLDYGADQSDQS
jgi:hypothetical protein